jgi:hypothetical protein
VQLQLFYVRVEGVRGITFRGNREAEAVVKKEIGQFPVSQAVKDVPLYGSFVR